ncbi:MAG: hypothetical protein RI967_531 [Planctomycetota bacterium]
MKRTHLAWMLWALVPVGLAAFHFGPGQRLFLEDRAAREVAAAERLQDAALALQAEAYDAHVAAIAARVAAFGRDDPALRAAAEAAGAAEEAAYAKAADAWRTCADSLASAQALVEETDGATGLRSVDRIRLGRARALVRTGDVAAGANELEDLVLALEEAGEGDGPLALGAREELATAYYYGARLMRMAGKPADEWREVAARARQNFRYLAERARDGRGDAATAANHEKNVELVLDLEQSSLDELFAKPRPKDSPTGTCNGLGKNPGKGRRGKRPGEEPSKGAGMGGDIGDGW